MPTIFRYRSRHQKQEKPASPGKTQRLPQRQRVKADRLPGFQLTGRDRAILSAVYSYRALTTKQIQRLFFSSSSDTPPTAVNSRCLHRLKLLYHHRLLLRGEQPQLLAQGRKPFIYFLDRAGAELLARLVGCAVRDLDWRPGEYRVGHLFLDHLLATNDVRIAVQLAARTHGFTVERWLDEKMLKRSHMKETVTLIGPRSAEQQAAVVPDGYSCLQIGRRSLHLFYEIDMSTVTGASRTWGRRTWARKVAAYLAYYRSGQYHERYHTKGMRVLCVTTGAKRLAHLKKITEKAGGRARFWFTTFAEIEKGDVLADPIWAIGGRKKRAALIG